MHVQSLQNKCSFLNVEKTLIECCMNRQCHVGTQICNKSSYQTVSCFLKNIQCFLEIEEICRGEGGGYIQSTFGSILAKHSLQAPASCIENWFTGTKLCYKYSQ